MSRLTSAVATITGVKPAEVNRELGDASITITGTGFAAGAVATLDPTVGVLGTTVQTSTRIVATVGIRRDTAMGFRDLTVRNPNGWTAVRNRALEIVDRPIGQRSAHPFEDLARICPHRLVLRASVNYS